MQGPFLRAAYRGVRSRTIPATNGTSAAAVSGAWTWMRREGRMDRAAFLSHCACDKVVQMAQAMRPYEVAAVRPATPSVCLDW